MTLIIHHEGEAPRVYENVVAVDFIDKENCENQAGRELTKAELNKIGDAIKNCEQFPTETELKQIIEELDLKEE